MFPYRVQQNRKMLTTIRPEVSNRIIELVKENWKDVKAPGRSIEANRTRNKAWEFITDAIKRENPGLLTDVTKIKKHWHYMKFQLKGKSHDVTDDADSNNNREMIGPLLTKDITPVADAFEESTEHKVFQSDNDSSPLACGNYADLATCSNVNPNESLSKVYFVGASSSVHPDEASTSARSQDSLTTCTIEDTVEGENITETPSQTHSTPKITGTTSLKRGLSFSEPRAKKRAVAVGFPSSGMCSIRSLQAKVLQAQLENEKMRKVVLEKTNRLLDKAESVGLVELIAQACGAVFFDVETVDGDV